MITYLYASIYASFLVGKGVPGGIFIMYYKNQHQVYETHHTQLWYYVTITINDDDNIQPAQSLVSDIQVTLQLCQSSYITSYSRGKFKSYALP